MLLNVNPMWDKNRPVLVTVGYIGNLHRNPAKELSQTEGSRILTVVSTPALSHQIVFRPIVADLLKQGHTVTHITTNPVHIDGKTPENLTEIDVGPASYEVWRKAYTLSTFGKANYAFKAILAGVGSIPKIVGLQLQNEQVQRMIKEETFDLVIGEGWVRTSLIWSQLFKAPMLKISSMTTAFDNSETMGVPIHPLLYPTCFHQKLYDLTIPEIIYELYTRYYVDYVYDSVEIIDDEITRRLFGDEVGIRDLRKNVDALLLNVNPMWDKNRPLPVTVGYIGNLHRKPAVPLPKDLQAYLDASKNGVIYMSFGTNVPPSKLSPRLTAMFANVFRELPYNVLWKWDLDVVEGMPENVRTARWFPQADVFRHPNMKLVITQGGLQTSEEAIDCGLPLVGIPFLADQWLNVDNYVHHGMGKYLDVETLTAEEFKAAIVEVIENERYRASVVRFRALVHDRAQSPAQLVSWWTARLLRHGGAAHMRAPAADMSLLDYLQLELVLIVLFCCFCLSATIAWTAVIIFNLLLRIFGIKI